MKYSDAAKSIRKKMIVMDDAYRDMKEFSNFLDAYETIKRDGDFLMVITIEDGNGTHTMARLGGKSNGMAVENIIREVAEELARTHNKLTNTAKSIANEET